MSEWRGMPDGGDTVSWQGCHAENSLILKCQPMDECMQSFRSLAVMHQPAFSLLILDSCPV